MTEWPLSAVCAENQGVSSNGIACIVDTMRFHSSELQNTKNAMDRNDMEQSIRVEIYVYVYIWCLSDSRFGRASAIHKYRFVCLIMFVYNGYEYGIDIELTWMVAPPSHTNNRNILYIHDHDTHTINMYCSQVYTILLLRVHTHIGEWAIRASNQTVHGIRSGALNIRRSEQQPRKNEYTQQQYI